MNQVLFLFMPTAYNVSYVNLAIWDERPAVYMALPGFFIRSLCSVSISLVFIAGNCFITRPLRPSLVCLWFVCPTLTSLRERPYLDLYCC